MTAAAAYLLGQSTAEGRPLAKKHKKVQLHRVWERVLHHAWLAPLLAAACNKYVAAMSPQAFLLVIQQEYKSVRDRDAFIALFEPLAKYVVQHEKTTLAYELSISDKDPHKVIIFERCGQHNQFAALHAVCTCPCSLCCMGVVQGTQQAQYTAQAAGEMRQLVHACLQVHRQGRADGGAPEERAVPEVQAGLPGRKFGGDHHWRVLHRVRPGRHVGSCSWEQGTMFMAC